MTWSVVGCRECDHLWIVEDLEDQHSVECPRCGHTRRADLVRSLKRSEKWKIACEERARLLAHRAGEFDEFVDEWGEFIELESEIEDRLEAIHEVNDELAEERLGSVADDSVDERLGISDDDVAAMADAYFDEQRVRRRAVYGDRADEYLDRRWATLDVDYQATADGSFDVFKNEPGDLTPHLDTTSNVQADVHARADQSPADLWRSVATADGFQAALVEAVRDLLSGGPVPERVQTLREAGVTAANGGLARYLVALDRAAETDDHQRALELVASIGQDGVTDVGHLPIEAVVDGPLALLDAAEIAPTVSVVLGQDFRERRREQRETTLWLLAALGRVADVQVVMSGVTARWLRSEHRADLPSTFSARCTDGRSTENEIERIEAARETLDPEGRPVRVLRDLAAEPAETLSYSELVSLYEVSRSRVSQILSQLEDLGLVERYGPRDHKQVDLLPAGSTFLDVLDDELDREDELAEAFSGSGQADQRPCNHADGKDPPAPPTDADRTADGAAAPYRTRYLDRPGYLAAAGTAERGAVTAVNAHVPEPDDAAERHTRFVSYNADRDEAVVAVRATTCFQYITSIATALSSPRFLDKALPVDRLERIDKSPKTLRDDRCIGGLSSEAESDPEILRDNLVEWGQEIEMMTTDLKREEYEDRDRFRGAIMRSAQGLAGTIVHLLDVAGVDIVRELRLPDYPDDEILADMARTVAIATTIQSRYRDHTVFRQMFETRERKLKITGDLEPDAANPFGTYIGGFVVRGPRAHRFANHLEAILSSPLPVREGAPEIAVRVPVRTPDRTDYAEVVSRMCGAKNLRSTSEAVTLFRTLTDPFGTAEAIGGGLLAEDRPRDIRLDEVRVALSSLDPEQLLQGTTTSVSKILLALLATDRELTQTELADHADVSNRTLRRHLDTLVATGLVRDTENGYRFALPFATDEERGEHILPDAVDDEIAVPQDILIDVAGVFVDDVSRFGDPDDPVGGAFIGFPPDLEGLKAALPGIDPWVRIAKLLCNAPELEPTTVQFGASIEQTALPVSLENSIDPSGSTPQSPLSD